MHVFSLLISLIFILLSLISPASTDLSLALPHTDHHNQLTLTRSPTGEGGGGGGQQGGGQRWSARWAGYLRSLRWTPIPLGVGFALIAYQQYRHVLVRERKRTAEGELDGPVIARPWEVGVAELRSTRSALLIQHILIAK